jgi:protein-S-isoprenylcysteine O-methyltransferase Ste14
MLSYVLLGLVTIHFLTAGTDVDDLLPTTSIVLIGVATAFGAAMLLTWRTAPRVRTTVVPPPAPTDLVTDR